MSSAGAAGNPMTMTDWNARQRALKEQDRKSKNASAEALRNYRGVGTLREEDTMLTALKEQDRKKKEETAEQMRHYRGAGLRDEDTKLSMLRQQDRQHKQDAEKYLHEYREKDVDVKTANRPEQARIIPDAIYSGGKWNPEDDIAPGSVSNIRESFSTTSETPTPPVAPPTRAREPGTPTPVPEPEPPAVVERSNKFVPKSNNNNNSLSSPQEKKVNGHQTTPSVTATSTTSASTNSAAPEAPPLKRLDVKFSFGIVSLADTPSLEGYLIAVKDIVERGLTEDNNLGSQVSIDGEFLPFVNEVEKDDTYKDQSGRSNVKRFLVKASVPIFVKGGFSSQSARRGVIAVLQQAIQSGVLLSNAAGKV